nr:reverse transcriptase N-terminal domain-containing protein [Pseudofrankia sp. BMG5.36]
MAAAGVSHALVNGSEEPLDWDAIDWRAEESKVRRLRQRIFKATQAGDWKQARNLQKLTAPRGAWSYARLSREELEGRFLGPMANLGLKGAGGQQHARKPTAVSRRKERRVGGPARYGQSWIACTTISRRCNCTPAGKTPETGAGPAPASLAGRCNLRGAERCPVRVFKEMSVGPKSRYHVRPGRTWDHLRGASPTVTQAS